jgi:hypothetical protein
MVDMIGVAKAALWEEAKGKLRALIAVNGQCSPTDEWRSGQWQEAEKRIDAFIADFEGDALHE